MTPKVQLLVASQTALWFQAQQVATPWLSADEQQRWHSLTTELRQREFIACRYGLRQVLALSGMQTQGLHLSAKAGYAPQVLASTCKQPAPQLSLSHSQQYVSCASAPFALGVDLEVLPSNRLRNVDAMAQMVCSPSELQILSRATSTAEQTALFIKFWVLKEALFKHLGTGINFQRIAKISCYPQSAISAPGRVVGHAWLWESCNAQKSHLIWALCTSHFVQIQDVKLTMENRLTPSTPQSWSLLEA